ncbi:hypothetical protein A5641_09465 [Mycobacterium sp. 1554424.7]|nr:hypothetical protein A5641_09465 [Mycobacterium sp. 1554424.7]
MSVTTSSSSFITSISPQPVRCCSASGPNCSARSTRFISIDPVTLAGLRTSEVMRRSSGADSPD